MGSTPLIIVHEGNISVQKRNSQERETEFQADRDERRNGEEGTGGNGERATSLPDYKINAVLVIGRYLRKRDQEYIIVTGSCSPNSSDVQNFMVPHKS